MDTYTDRKRRRLEHRIGANKPSPERVKATFAPIEGILRDLISGTYARLPSGTPVILYEDSAVPMFIAIDTWFDYWKRLAKRQQSSICFHASDNLVACLRQGKSYVKKPDIDAVRVQLRDLKQLYASLPCSVTSDLLLDVQIFDSFEWLDTGVDGVLAKYPELRKDLRNGITQ